MYTPSHFAEQRLEVLHALIQAHPLATLVTDNGSEMEANHIPFIIAPASSAAPYGVLRGHVARSNPVWQTACASKDALLIFQGAQAYISPRWYEEKKQSGEVVPTYNYAVVHVYGPMRVVEDRAQFLNLLNDLSDHFETRMEHPWKVGDAPPEYIDRLMDIIVGIEIPIRRMTGKWKASQNRMTQDRINVVNGLREQRNGDSNRLAMADMMEQQLFTI